MRAEPSDTFELRQQTLRSELKAWEHLFAKANGGRKAGKEDIKRDPEIGEQVTSEAINVKQILAAKYKEYSKLRSRPSDVSIAVDASTPKKPRKRKSDTQEEVEYPTAKHPATIDPYDIPQHMSVTPRIIRTFIGPTPQKNGQVMGLFDTLSPSSVRTATPSKSKSIANQMALSPATMQTPSNKRTRDVLLAGLQATPSNSANRTRGNENKTPSTQRQRALTGLTPSSSRLNVPEQLDLDQTPVFLKRYSDPLPFASLANDLGTDIGYSPPKNLRVRRKPIGRSLSQMAQSLRQNEDDRLDEEMALMHEIETGISVLHQTTIPDSQAINSPFEPDHENGLADGATVPKEAEPRTVWKKKGQKRTTRRANIGVNRAKWRPEIEWRAGYDSDDNDEETVPDTQAGNTDPAALEKSGHQKSTSGKAKDVFAAGKGATQGKKTRKINPNAVSHANFRSLKIKNKNSKGKGRGRFGRR